MVLPSSCCLLDSRSADGTYVGIYKYSNPPLYVYEYKEETNLIRVYIKTVYAEASSTPIALCHVIHIIYLKLIRRYAYSSVIHLNNFYVILLTGADFFNQFV